MLADPRLETLTKNFGGQWLLVRNMATVRPGENYALAFDETLRQRMQRETELFSTASCARTAASSSC